jgi:hypothetical protein
MFFKRLFSHGVRSSHFTDRGTADDKQARQLPFRRQLLSGIDSAGCNPFRLMI